MGDIGYTAIDGMMGEFDVEYPVTKAAITEAQRLRHKVFCEERNILDSEDGIESDEFDSHSHHVALRRRCGTMVATARVVTFRRERPHRSFPMQLVCQPGVLAGVPLETTAEISRFAISRELRRGDSNDSLLRLGLMQGILGISQRLRLTHWCAAMEPSLLRLLRRTAIHFNGVGPMIEYRGLRQPAVCSINDTLRQGRVRLPAVWSYATRQGHYGERMRHAA